MCLTYVYTGGTGCLRRTGAGVCGQNGTSDNMREQRKDHLERASRGGNVKVRIGIQTPASNEKLLHLLLVPPAAERAALG